MRSTLSLALATSALALFPATAAAERYSVLRFFAEPGPPPAGADPLVGQCFAHTAGDAALGTTPCNESKGLNSAYHVEASADGRHLYVASALSDSITVFSRDPASGRLTRRGCISDGGVDGCSSGRALQGAIASALSPDGRNLYVSARTGDAVAVFERDPASGALSQLADDAGCMSEGGVGGCRAATALDHAVGVQVSGDGKNVYVASRGGDAVAAFAREPASGALSQLAGADGCIRDALTSTVPLAGCTPGRGLDGAYSVTLSSGGEHLYLTSRVSDAATAFVRSADGTLSQLPGGPGCISRAALGDCAPAGRGFDGATALALSGDGGAAYVASYASDSLEVLARDPRSGALAFGGCFSEGTDRGCAPARGLDYADALAVTPDDRDVFVSGGYASAIAIFARTAGGLVQQPPPPGRTWSDGCISWRGHRWARAVDLSRPDHSDHYCARSLALYYPYWVEPSPDGRHLYVASTVSDSVTLMQRLELTLPDPPATSPPPSPSASPPATVRARDRRAPRLELGGARSQRLGRSGAVALLARCDERCTLRAWGSTRVQRANRKRYADYERRRRGSRLLRTRTVDRSLPRAGEARLRLPFSRSALRSLRRALARGARLTLTVSVRARDGAGNSSSATRVIRIRR